MNNIAWQTPVVIVLSGCAFAVALVLDPSSGITVSPIVAVLLKTLAFVVPLATNQLKAIGGAPPR